MTLVVAVLIWLFLCRRAISPAGRICSAFAERIFRLSFSGIHAPSRGDLLGLVEEADIEPQMIRSAADGFHQALDHACGRGGVGQFKKILPQVRTMSA